MVAPSSPSARALLGCLAAALLLSPSAASGADLPAWEVLPRLTDVRHEGARDVGPAVLSSGEATISLPFGVPVNGRASRNLVVGPGWMRLVPTARASASLEGAPRLPPASEPDGGGALDVELLPRGLAQVGPGSRVLVTAAVDGLAVRWVGLAVPGGGVATVEALVDRAGNLTLQWLRLPASLQGVLAGTPGAPVTALNATAQRLRIGGPVVLDPPSGPVGPHRSDPPPPTCTPETGTWCDRADGPGSSQVWLVEGFDDLGALSRGWIMTGQWHQIPSTTCPPGASTTPGGSAYHGVDGSCVYDPLVFGSLVSPPFGPVTAGSQFTWSSRIQYEGGGFDFAQIYVNGTLIGDMPNTLDPGLWYNFNPIDLSPWAGQMVQIEFFFQSDDTFQQLGWFVDDVVAWNPLVGNPNCLRNAGIAGSDPCSQRQSTQWDFNESTFCQNCQYTFYILVECGREMHLPLQDMEGADITVTNVEDPTRPIPLRCINDTARGDAGTGPYRGIQLPDETGAALDCCAPPGPEVWFGPAFDVLDPDGHVAWGLAQGCPTFFVYDPDNPDDGLDCVDLPADCSRLSLASPGEEQVMDCFIQEETGLCGLYRVDVVSGGNVWHLFANCDGTNTPQFPIFFDCTEAWTAYNPLPELTVTNLVLTPSCPDLVVDFDLVNVGCGAHSGDAVVRIQASGADASCGLPPNVLDETITGPFPPGTTVHVTRTIAAPCSPVRIDVTSDPLDAVAECTESPGAAACRRDVGIDTISAFECGCTAQLSADAGLDDAGCPGLAVRLDASGSVVTACGTRTLYRWLDDTGRVVRDWGPVPTHDVPVSCPAGRTYTVEIACDGEPCTDSAAVTIACVVVTPDAGADVMACTGETVTLDGSASTVSSCAQPLYRWMDNLGNEVRGWTTDPSFTIPAMSCDLGGDWLLEVGCAGETCTNYDFVTVSCVQVLANAGPDLPGCDGIPVDITGARSTATNCSSVLYQWVDITGTPVSGVLTDPDFSVTLNGCPGVAQLFLVAACADTGFETCGTFDVMEIACGNPQPPVPAATATCAGADVRCGAAEAGVTYWWDADVTADSDGNTVPDDDRDLNGCDGIISYPDAAVRDARAWASDAGGCLSFAETPASALAAPADPVPTADPGCPGAITGLACGSAEPGVSWDFDVAVDSDGNTVPDDDADATTCDATARYAAGTRTARVTVTAAGGCSSSADVLVDVAATTTPPETGGDRVAKAGTSVTLTWSPAAGASTYRVSRGSIGTWYDHAADAGRGACDTAGAVTFTDPDDAGDLGDYYYLITAVEPCGLEGPAGSGFDGTASFARPARVPTAACP